MRSQERLNGLDMNYEFHLNDWLPRFPLEESFGRYEACDITGPRDICTIEWLRRGMVDQYDWGTPVPVDVFIQSMGEPEHRFATKLGGLPYRPSQLAWPRGASGRPLSFIAQFNFSNSRDIVGPLPGDLLLVFGDHSTDLETLHMEWQSLGDHDLIGRGDIPAECAILAPYFGNRWRMNSHPDGVRTNDLEFPLCNGKEVWSDHWILQPQANQIGRAPFFIQEGDNALAGQPLCTIASVVPSPEVTYPFVNVSEPISTEEMLERNRREFLIGDLGCIYIFMEPDGTLHSCTSSF